MRLTTSLSKNFPITEENYRFGSRRKYYWSTRGQNRLENSADTGQELLESVEPGKKEEEWS